ncbi:MAG: hypothetical protein ACRDQC_15555, partial [Gaiellales bacterium]
MSLDGTTLVETGFKLVPASRCPDHASGTVHSDFNGPVDASGRIVNPDGLRATIRGRVASGVVFDHDVCGSKT